MKEATGEANMTIVTVVLIGVVSAAAAIFIPRLMSTTTKRSCCMNNGGNWVNGKCEGASDVCQDDTNAGSGQAQN